MFDEPVTHDRLERLATDHLIAFGASCCERLAPSYRAFWIMHKWGNPGTLETALDVMWRRCSERVDDPDRVRALLAECDLLAPDDEAFGTIFTQQAIGAVGAIWSLLDFSLSRDVSRIVAIATTAVETTKYYVMAVNWPSGKWVSPDEAERLENWIKTAPLVQAEIEKQRRDLGQLEAIDVLDTAFVDEFRTAANDVGIHPIRRGLVAQPAQR